MKAWRIVIVPALLVLGVGCGNSGMARGPMMTGPGAVTGTATATEVVSVSPAANSVGVAPSAPIVLRFNHPMASGMEQYLLLHRGDLSGPVVPMTCVFSPDRTTLTCTPHAPLARHTLYTIHMGAGMMDATGHPLDLDDMPMMGGQWIVPGMMGGGMGWMMGPGWQGANGSYGVIFTFTTD